MQWLCDFFVPQLQLTRFTLAPVWAWVLFNLFACVFKRYLHITQNTKAQSRQAESRAESSAAQTTEARHELSHLLLFFYKLGLAFLGMASAEAAQPQHLCAPLLICVRVVSHVVIYLPPLRVSRSFLCRKLLDFMCNNKQCLLTFSFCNNEPALLPCKHCFPLPPHPLIESGRLIAKTSCDLAYSLFIRHLATRKCQKQKR